jgi:hypothetical protein
MSSESVGTKRRSRPRLRHPAEVPFLIFMVVLNILIIAAILDAAAVLPFLPERLEDTGWATAIRVALIALLLFVPALILVREIQRASTRGTAVQLSQRQFPDLYRTAEDFAHQLGLRRPPEIFLANGNGALNAFAAQATGYDYVVLSNELFVNLHTVTGTGLDSSSATSWATSACTMSRSGTRSRSPTASSSRCSGRRCHGCVNTPATGTAPTCRRSAPRDWSCWPPAATPRPTSTWRSLCGRAASCGGSGSASPNCRGRTRSRFAAWSVCIAWACSMPMPGVPRRDADGRRHPRSASSKPPTPNARGAAGPACRAGSRSWPPPRPASRWPSRSPGRWRQWRPG